MESIKGSQKVKRLFALPLAVFSFALILAFILVNIQEPIQKTFLNNYQTIPRSGYQLPTSPRLGAYPLLSRPSPIAYDEQLGIAFTQNSASLTYTVTAIAQSGTDGYGPAYLVNGLGNTGYWYQVGLSYNWDPVTASGFHLAYSVFNPSGNVVFPVNTGAGMATFSPVNPGDTVLISLSFSNGNVIMQGTDQNTGAQAQETYAAEGSTFFVGSPSSLDMYQGFFTGLMTEWYHSAPYYGGEQSVTYSDKGAAIPSAWLWMDEFSVSQRGIGSTLFSASSPSPVTFTNPNQLQTLSSNGATEAANATEFITGQITPVVLLTFGYSVAGGAVLPPAPVLTYYAAGVKETATLTQSEQAFSVDTGTSWSITNPLSSSTTTERWQTPQITTGTATSPQTIDFVFYHQYLVTFGFSIVGGGSSYSPPAATCQRFGDHITPAMGTQIWADATQYSLTNPLPGLSSSEQWTTNSASGTVLSPGRIDVAYSHQYYVTTKLDPVAGGSISVMSGWFDTSAPFQTIASPNSGWQFETWSGSGQGSYSGSSSSLQTVVNAPLTETAIFYPGLTITMANHISGSYAYGSVIGSISPSTPKTIFAPSGTNIQLTAKSKLFIYSFSGWTGSATSNKSSISVVLNAPLSITANFSYNYVVIGVVSVAVIAVIVAAAVFVALRRRKSVSNVSPSQSETHDQSQK